MTFSNEVKGTGQLKLTGVESDINLKVLLLHWTADIYFLNFKGTCSLNSKEPVLVAKTKYVTYPIQWCVRCK
jgi:hypothetical protein